MRQMKVLLMSVCAADEGVVDECLCGSVSVVF